MFKENYIISGKIVCESGLHIGDSTDGIDIGGSDSPIIRDSITGLPYIPGSSLKGKLRSLLELSDKQSSEIVIKNDGKVSDEDCIATQLFGLTPKETPKDDEKIDTSKTFKTRMIVRDSQPSEDTKKLWEKYIELADGSELKWENTINRITAKATPRNIERVPKGSKFNFEIIFSTYDGDENKNLLRIFESMKLLENDYLGGSGSRGSGQVKFEDISIFMRNIDYYTDDGDEIKITENSSIDEAVSAIKENIINKE